MPLNFKATAGVREVKLTWTRDPAATQYILLRRTGTAPFSVHQTLASVGEFTDTQLTIDVRYDYRLRAKNSYGESSETSTVDAVPILPAPTGFKLTPRHLSAEVAFNAVEGAKGYRACPVGSTSCWGANAPASIISPLVNDQAYTIRIAAVSSAGWEGAWSEPLTVTPQPAPEKPVITSVRANINQIEIAWTTHSSAKNYEVTRYDGPSHTSLAILGNVGKYVDKTYTGGKPYTYIILAKNDFGFTDSAGYYTAGMPLAPTELKATPKSQKVELTWNLPSGEEHRYRVERAEGTTGAFAFLSDVVTGVPYVATGLTDGKTYRFRVSVERASGDRGPASQPVTATPGTVPDSPQNVVATSGVEKIDVRWDPVPGATSYSVVASYGDVSECASPGLTETRCSDMKAPAGEPQNYRVYAHNHMGRSNPSSASAAATRYDFAITYSPASVRLKTGEAIEPAISPSATGGQTITECKAVQQLPPELELSSKCQVYGTPAYTSTKSTFAFIGKTATGKVGTGSLEIEILDRPPTIQYLPSEIFLSVGEELKKSPQSSGGAITACASDPALPDGVKLGSTDCQLDGKPTTEQSSKEYTITASNSGGTGSTRVRIVVLPKPKIEEIQIDSTSLIPGRSSQSFRQVVRMTGGKLYTSYSHHSQAEGSRVLRDIQGQARSLRKGDFYGFDDTYCWITPEERVRCYGLTGSISADPGLDADERALYLHGMANSPSFYRYCVATSKKVVKCWEKNESPKIVPGISATDAPLEVTVGGDVACARLTSGKVFCWESPSRSGTPGPNVGFIPLPSGTRATALQSKAQHTCALLNDGRVYCWGDGNWNGDLGDGIRNASDTRALVKLASGEKAVAFHETSRLGYGGGQPFCIILQSKAAKCWGSNSMGQLGAGTNTGVGPIQVAINEGIQSIFGAQTSLCALTESGNVYCWGENLLGRTGVSPFKSASTQSLYPKKIVGITGAKALVTDGYRSCATVGSGSGQKHYCWGGNLPDLLSGSSSWGGVFGLQLVATSGSAKALSLDGQCVLLADGSARCWGPNIATDEWRYYDHYVAYPGVSTPRAVSLPNGGKIAQIAHSSDSSTGRVYYSLAVSTSSELYSWPDSTADAYKPEARAPGVKIKEILVSTHFACAIDTVGYAYCTRPGSTAVQLYEPSKSDPVVALASRVLSEGDNPIFSYFHLHKSGKVTRDGKVYTASTSDRVVSIHSDHWQVMALHTSGKAVWLADDLSATPVTLEPDDRVSRISLSPIWQYEPSQACLTLSTGALTCLFKEGSYSLVPKQIALAGTDRIREIVTGSENSGCAGLEDGRVKCWGKLFGAGAAHDAPKALTFGSGEKADSLQSNGVAVCARMASGQVRCWGDLRAWGYPGDSTGITSTPLAIEGLTAATGQLSMGKLKACTLLTTGRAACWGSNHRGGLGNGIENFSTSPIEVKNSIGAP